jgi:hypothetical protein
MIFIREPYPIERQAMETIKLKARYNIKYFFILNFKDKKIILFKRLVKYHLIHGQRTSNSFL